MSTALAIWVRELPSAPGFDAHDAGKMGQLMLMMRAAWFCFRKMPFRLPAPTLMRKLPTAWWCGIKRPADVLACPHRQAACIMRISKHARHIISIRRCCIMPASCASVWGSGIFLNHAVRIIRISRCPMLPISPSSRLRQRGRAKARVFSRKHAHNQHQLVLHFAGSQA